MIQQLIRIFLFTASFAGVMAVAVPAPVSADCGGFLTFPPWYRGVVDTGSCELKAIGESGDISLNDFITIVIINIVEMILQLVAYAAAVMLIVGGFKYITSQGDQNSMANAKKTITNSIIGLIVAIFSVAIVNIVGGAL